MFHIPGSPYRLCDGISRRDFLRVGSLGAAGLTLPALLQGRAAAGPGLTGKAKSCILLYMSGGPPQMDTFDLKPDAPPEVRGELKPIATNVSGIRISESLPLLSKHADKYAIIRSVCFNMSVGSHGGAVYLTLTGGHQNPRVGDRDDVRPLPEDFPCLGSVVARSRPGNHTIPPFVWLLDMYRTTFAGEGAGFLGKGYDPFRVLQDPNHPSFRIAALTPPTEVTASRFGARRDLLEQVDRQTAPRSGSVAGMSAHYEKAFDLMSSAQTQRAFDLRAESDRVRDRYGRNKFGQGVLLARRLVEHGVPLTTVFWNGVDSGRNWDLHYNSYPLLKLLLPPLDQAFSALLDDLAHRGLLDETLVVWMGEFGRAPRIEDKGGRGHWGRCFSVVMAGGGIRGGQVYGKSDSQAAVPAENPVSPGDVVATIYQCLGIDPNSQLIDQLGRPLRVCQGDAIQALLS
jgi:hypothetical protein